MSSNVFKRAKRIDGAMRWLITIGGVTIILTVILILLLILGVTLPLFMPASIERHRFDPLPEAVRAQPIVAAGTGEYLENSYVMTADGTVTFLDITEDAVEVREDDTTQVKPASGESLKIKSIEKFDATKYGILWEDNSQTLCEIIFRPVFDDDSNRTITVSVDTIHQFEAESGATPVFSVLRETSEGAMISASLLENNRIRVVIDAGGDAGDDTGGMGLLNLGRDDQEEKHLVVTLEDMPATLQAITMDSVGKTIYAITDQGHIVFFEIDEDHKISTPTVVDTRLRERPSATPSTPRELTAVRVALGDFAVIVADADGKMETWMPLRDKGDQALSYIHTLRSHSSPVTSIQCGLRNRTLLTRNERGGIQLDYITNERHLLNYNPSNTAFALVTMDPRGNAITAIDENNSLYVYKLDNPHPEFSLKTIFGSIHYEGYSQPRYVWQSSAAEDSFEPKLSLVPIVFGTFKGTLYAMIFALPLALFGAAYTSQFASPWWKKIVKPTVELMAAVPSVVIGFLVGLWLAPIFADYIVGVFVSFATVPLVFAAFMFIWQFSRSADWCKRIETGFEFIVLIPVMFLGCLLAFMLAGTVEQLLFDGNFQQWLWNFTNGEMRYDQRNCIIIAFGLGFAVIPIIFSISEDSLSNVPPQLTAASLALGASRWQTVWNIVLPSASPGIFAATMIGLGRAVGETMIVLMATGNTPIIDISPFNGMRTLSANIAVEVPEAPQGGTLYRILFLCAVVLFIFTFFFNTVAEIVRDRLRKKYGRF